MYNTQYWNAPTIPFAVADVGNRIYSRLNSGKRTHGLLFRIRGTVTLAAGPATALRNAGSLWSLVDFIGMEDNGRDIALLSGRMLRALSQMCSAKPLSATRVTSFANGALTLEETAFLPFAWPRSVSPVETCYVEPDPRNALQAFAVFNNNGAVAGNSLMVTTPGTAQASGVTITVQQVFDDDMSLKPLFSPFYRVIQEPVTAAVQNSPLYLKSNKYLRGILAQQDTNVGEVDDIITSLIIRGDDKVIAGPQAILNEDLVRNYGEPRFGGSLTAAGISATVAQPDSNVYTAWEFAENGRLSNVLNPNLDLNLRLEYTGQPSAAALATSSQIRVLMMELERIAGVTSDVIPFAA